ncbi:MAG: PCI domain-containing protein [Candidatus Helarchaeota archaeon]
MAMTKILPFWVYTRRIYPFTKDIMDIQAEIIHAFQLNQVSNVQDAFWSIFALDSVKKLDMIDSGRIEKLILANLKGFKFYNQKYKKDDLKTLFCALAALKILGRLDEFSDKAIDGFANSVISYDTNNGFVHCYDSLCQECGGKSSFESIFYGIATLHLLNRIEKLDLEKYYKILSTKIGKKSTDLVYYLLSIILLNRRDLIDEIYYDKVLEYEDERGGFKFTGPTSTISDTFWVVSLYGGLDWLKTSRNLGRILEFIRSIYRKKEEKISFYEMDLNDYCFATLIISFIYDDLTENVKIEILKQLYEREFVFYEELIETNYVKKDIIELIIDELKNKSWFNISIINNEDNYKEYLRTLSNTKQILAEEIIKLIKENNKLNLTEYAANVKSGAVIEITKTMLLKKIIIGTIETVGRFLRKEHYIFRGYMPEKGIKRESTRDSIPYFEVIEERERFPHDEKEISDILNQMKLLPSKIYDKVFNLVDCDKVNIANIELKNEFKEALEYLNKSNSDIQKKFSKYKYLSKNYIKNLENQWSNTLEDTRIRLNEINKELQSLINKKQTSLKALKDLEDFQEYVEKNLKQIKNSVEDITKIFQESVNDQKLEKNKDVILEKINNLILEIDRLTPNLQTQVELLNKIVEKAKLIENFDDSGVKFVPLHTWLEKEFLNKRSYTLKTLSDIKSKLFKRDELKTIINDKKTKFDENIKNIEGIINRNIGSKNFEAAASTLKDKTRESLKFIENTNKYIIDFIKDTTNLIDGFDYVVDDIVDYWLNEIISQMQNQIVNLKKDLEKKIISEKELDRRNKLDSLIEKNINDIKRMIDEFRTYFENRIEKEPNIEILIKELDNKFSEIKKIIITCHQQFNKTLKTNLSEFKNFNDTANVQIFKWNSFKSNSEEKLNLLYNVLVDKIIIKTIELNQNQFRGGRVKLDVVKESINLKTTEIKKRIKDMIASGTIDGELYTDKDEVVIFTQERKEILDFEDRVNKFLTKLNAENKNVNNFYIKSCKKRQIESAIPEIFNEIKEIFDKSNNFDSEIKKEIEDLQKNAVDVKIIVNKWVNFKSDVQSNLLKINNTLRKRLDLKELINDSISIFKVKINELSVPIINLIQNKQLNAASQLLKTRISSLIKDIKELDVSIQDTIQKEESRYFKTLVSDLIDKWKENQTLLFDQIQIIKIDLEEKIKNIRIIEKQKELEKFGAAKIHDLEKIREEMEEIVFPQVSIDLKIAQKKLLTIHASFQTAVKNSIRDFNAFIKDVSSSISIDFKRVSDIQINKFHKDLAIIEDLFDQTYQMLEDEMIIKNIEDLKTAYGSISIDLNLIANNLKISKTHVRNRIVHLIASEKLKGIIDPESNEYKFSEYVSEDERKSHVLVEEASFFKKLSDLLKRWQSIVAFIATTITIGITLISLTNNILPGILIPILSILAAVIFVLFKHYKEKKIKIN